MAYLLTQEASAVEQNSSSRDGKKEDRKEEVTEVSMKLCLVLFTTTLFSGLYRRRTSIRTNFLLLMQERSRGARSKFQLYSADSVSRPHIVSASNFVFLIFGC